MWIPIMFGPSATSTEAGRQFLERVRRRDDRDEDVSAETAAAHFKAATAWGARRNDDGFAELRRIECPTLVVNGSDDIVIATVNSFILQQHIPDAKLVLYPDSNHGAHFQFHDDFVQQVRLFSSEPALVAR